jgi:signal transduction histidine kinase
MLTTRTVTGYVLFFLFLCTVLPCGAASLPLVLHNSTESLRLSGHIDILEDKTGQLTIKEVSSPEMSRLFRPDTRAVPNFGMTSSVYWARFAMVSEAAAEKRWLLELDFPLMNYVDFYAPTEAGGFDQMRAGVMRPLSTRTLPHRIPVFPVIVDGTCKTFYLRIDAEGRAMMPLSLRTPAAFARIDSQREMIHGCYFGAMLVMVAYNFFIFLSLRDRSYLYYIIDIICFTLYMFSANGHLNDLVSGEIPFIASHEPVLSALAIFTGLLFCRNFLESKRNFPGIDRVMKIWMLVALLLIPAIFLLPPVLWKRSTSLLALCASVTGIIAAAACMRKGFHPARYYLGARIFRLLGLFALVLGMHNIIPLTVLTTSSLQIGSVFEVLLLSFALTDRINLMRREKEEAQADAIRASHLASLGELAAGVAHEINNPVNIIINSADLILESDGPADTKYDAAVIKKHGHRIATIVSSLLFFTRPPAREKIPFAMTVLLDGTLDMIGARLSKEHITITGLIPPDLPLVLVHPQQIEQVFLNILTNAMHALDEKHGGVYEGKRLDISATEVCIDDRPFVRIVFHDNGIGIPPELLGRVTESFVTTRKTGTGLGLSISKRIIDEHGGSLLIDSLAGEYTKVSVMLPVAGV